MCTQTSLLDLKEHASSLASSGLKKDSKLKSLEIALEQKKEECLKLENQLKRVSKMPCREQPRSMLLALVSKQHLVLLSGSKCSPGGSG